MLSYRYFLRTTRLVGGDEIYAEGKGDVGVVGHLGQFYDEASGHIEHPATGVNRLAENTDCAFEGYYGQRFVVFNAGNAQMVDKYYV